MKHPKPNPIRALCNSLPGGVSELAKEIGVTRQSIYSWTAGKKSPGPNSKRKLIDKYSLDISELTDLDYDPTQAEEGGDMAIAEELIKLVSQQFETMNEALRSMNDRLQNQDARLTSIINVTQLTMEGTNERLAKLENKE